MISVALTDQTAALCVARIFARPAQDHLPPGEAALALVEAVLQPSTTGERVPDELYAEAAEHFDPKALATLTTAIGQANFWMPVALIGRPLPGKPPKETWT